MSDYLFSHTLVHLPPKVLHKLLYFNIQNCFLGIKLYGIRHAWYLHYFNYKISSFVSKLHTYPRLNQTLNLISFIWEDDQIEKLDNYQWKFLWFEITFQGINYTKGLDQVFRKASNPEACTRCTFRCFSTRPNPFGAKIL